MLPARVVRERLGVTLQYLRQVSAVGGPTRDRRARWALSVLYRALVPMAEVEATEGKRVEGIAWRPVDEVAAASDLAFDRSRRARGDDGPRGVRARRWPQGRRWLSAGMRPLRVSEGARSGV
jgi:hypothetical protein